MIRTALIVQEREEFDQGYRQALAEAAETLELAGVLDTLEHCGAARSYPPTRSHTGGY